MGTAGGRGRLGSGRRCCILYSAGWKLEARVLICTMRSRSRRITLPPSEFRLVRTLKTRLGLKSNVEVVRKGLQLLHEATDRQALKEAYRRASRATRGATRQEIDALDHLSSEGID